MKVDVLDRLGENIRLSIPFLDKSKLGFAIAPPPLIRGFEGGHDG